jgi:hypothetical protein
MSFSARMIATGKLFQADAVSRANTVIDRRLAEGQAMAYRAIKAAAPVRTGELARSIVERGTGLDREVRSELPRAMSLEYGWTPRKAKVAARALKRGRQRKAFLAQAKIDAHPFMMPAWASVAPSIRASLAPLAAQIVEALQ